MRILLVIYCLSFLVNWVNLPSNLFFGHEQGRDAAAIKDIYTFKHFPLVGTKTEIEGFFSPPWYYYIMAIPYGLFQGNPIAGILSITLFNSTAAVIIFLSTKEVLKSTVWGVIASIITIFSWEFITYARWLINVSPAFPFVALAYYMVWKYCQRNHEKFLLFYFLSTIAASQFQITLVFQFAFVTLALLLLKIIKFPSPKILLLSLSLAIFAFSPLIIFDFRHDHLTLKSVLNFFNGSASNSVNLDPINSLLLYWNQLTAVIKRTLFNINNFYLQMIFFICLFIGFYLFAKKFSNRKIAILILISCFMSLGIFIFNIGLTQLYQGTGVGWVILTAVSLHSLWHKNTPTKLLAALISILLLVGWIHNFKNLIENNNFFFTPVQKSLSYKDQLDLINFMHTDVEVKPYRFESFTFPYLHSEGWQYLHQYLYPKQESKHSKILYIAIEKGVGPFWEKEWIKDLGETELVFEKKFGGIRLQKRIIKS